MLAPITRTIPFSWMTDSDRWIKWVKGLLPSPLHFPHPTQHRGNRTFSRNTPYFIPWALRKANVETNTLWSHTHFFSAKDVLFGQSSDGSLMKKRQSLRKKIQRRLTSDPQVHFQQKEGQNCLQTQQRREQWGSWWNALDMWLSGAPGYQTME